MFSQAAKINDLGNVTQKELLDIAGVSEAEYSEALEKKIIVLYKRRPYEMDIELDNTFILHLLELKLNIQFVTGTYAMLTY